MKVPHLLRFLLLFVFALPSVAQSTSASTNDLSSTLRKFLDLYAHKDVSGLMAMVADRDVLAMGSDISEVCTSRAQIQQLLEDDFKLWDSATFGSPERVFSQRSGNLVTAFFDAPFTLRRGGGEQTVTVRFAMVWKQTPQGLRMLQNANTTPTVGQSAKELLAPKK
ncbi:MAG: nuclear transport factor 2 family protein [Acidobacteriaceae bacterium]